VDAGLAAYYADNNTLSTIAAFYDQFDALAQRERWSHQNTAPLTYLTSLWVGDASANAHVDVNFDFDAQMSRDRALDLLRGGMRGIGVWNAWRAERKQQVDLRYAQLQNAYLVGIDFMKAELYGADLTGANLVNAYLKEADLRCVSLRSANLLRANLELTCMAGADLTDAEVTSSHAFGLDLRQAVLHGVNFSAVVLDGSNLSDAVAERVWFKQSHMVGVRFVSAVLTGADFSAADLTGSDFTNATLSTAVLKGANLRDCNFSSSDLRGARIEDTTLAGTRFDQADMTQVSFGNNVIATDMSTALHLESMEHISPSSFAMAALAESIQRLPRSFLKNSGLDDDEIDHLLRASSNDYYRCFISYSHKDHEFADTLREALTRHGVMCWLDVKDIVPGERFFKRIIDSIDQSDRVLLCCSSASLDSYWVDKEIGKAFKNEEELWKVGRRDELILIPLNLDDAVFTWSHPRATDLLERHACPFKGWKDDSAAFDAGLVALLKALRR
jgi:uncharacterized protein YjbI with pentapeptide repeats